MSPDEFRKHGHEVVDWIADYYERIETFPVLSQVAPGDDPGVAAAARRPNTASRSTRAARPGRGDPARHHALAAPVLLRLLPGQRQRPGDPRRPARLRARRAGHALGDLAGRDRTRDRTCSTGSPTCSACPRGSGPTDPAAASSSTPRPTPPSSRCSPPCTGPAAARTERDGVGHAVGTPSTPRARRTRRSRRRAGSPGSGSDALRKVDVDPATLAAQPDAPARADRGATRGAASSPALVVASVGTTGTGAVDPVPRTGPTSRTKHGAWLHVDAAWAGVAAVAPELRWLNDGRRARRLLLHQPAQVAAHQLRLRRVLGRRPGRADRRAVDPARVPAQRRDRVRRGDRLPRLAGAARAPVPRAEALGGDPLVRRGGPARAHPQPRRPGAGVRRPGSPPTSGSSWSRRTRCRW